ncbi:hypothetical protein QUF76_13450 [Desulfobacterales bacterium HSG16]|nr:hypothetical protein [Desulfobacterales bacterium HSG16]
MRPEMHKNFEYGSDSVIEQERDNVRKAIECKQKPDFYPYWRENRYKRAFSENQHGKCGYCESKVLAAYYGDIEHYAPKSEVHELVSPGCESFGLSNVTDRKTRQISNIGYWWLAYDWSNYLLACNRCNSAWKRNLFPIIESERKVRPDSNIPETPLLLNPFDDDPIPHLNYNDFGQIIGTTEQGRSTIETCGLDRESLRNAREEKARRMYGLLREFLDTNNSLEKQNIIRIIIDMGKENYAHSGMIRSMLYHEFKLTWRNLEEYLEAAE